MGQIFLPENIPSIVKSTSTAITLAATNNGQPTRINVGGQQYVPSATLTMSTATVGFNGLDTGALAANTLYYLYAVVSSNAVGLAASLTAQTTGPAGFTSAYKLLGRFRTDVGAATINTAATDASIQPQGAAAGPWFSYTPAVTNNGAKVFTMFGKWRRVVDSMEILIGGNGDATASGSTATTEVMVSTPSGYTMDVAGFPTGTNSDINMLGSSQWYSISTASQWDPSGIVIMGTSTSTVRFSRPSTTTPINYTTSSINIARGIQVDAHFTIPIAEWAGLYT